MWSGRIINELLGFRISFVAIALVVLAHTQGIAGNQCHPVKVNGDSKKLICVCNAEQCHDLIFDWPHNSGEAVLIQSTESGRRFESSSIHDHLSTSSSSKLNNIRIDLNKKYQPILGWGGAFTDAAVINIANLSDNAADKLLKSYYGEEGLQYNFGRVPIGGTDFSTRPYSYDDSQNPDPDLTSWALAPEDIQFKIPLIHKAFEIARSMGTHLKLFASPWSPPKWMKTNKSFVRGKLIDDDTVYKSYSEYLMKFYDAYLEHGIRFWGATVQNEPVAANLPIYFFNSLQFGNEQQIKFIAEYLGPALKARNYTKENFKLMVGDESLGLINLQVPTIMRDARVQEYVSGLAFHWYTSGTFVPYSALNQVVDAVKDKIEFVMMSEACTGSEPMQKKVDLGSWDRAEDYAEDMIEDLHRHTGAWIDWNLALNQKGGPNWSGNFVDSPIIVNSEKSEFYKQPMYYALAHFSRFFRPGSIRVDSVVKSILNFKLVNTLMSVAVVNEETGHLIVNILNKSSYKKDIKISIDGLENFLTEFHLPPISVPGKSINTVVFKL